MNHRDTQVEPHTARPATPGTGAALSIPSTVMRAGLVDLDEVLGYRAGQSGPYRQTMTGFDPEYADFVDYILRCTHRIWEQKGLGLIETHYGADCQIHTLAGEVNGVDAVIANTAATLTGFPDRTLYGEEVVWTEATAGFFSSHRITSHMTNRGWSEFGPPTHRHATVRTIADCVVRENRIVEEWLVRDNLALVMQLGLDPMQIAIRLAEQDAQSQPEFVAGRTKTALALLDSRPARAVGPEERTLPPSWPDPQSDAQRLSLAFDHALWHTRSLDEITEAYARQACVHAPSGRELHGHQAIGSYVLSLLSALPDAAMTVDHICETAHLTLAQGPSVTVATRWRLAGTHRGHGVYGKPSGNAVLILGVTHRRFYRNQIIEEWTVFDELAALRQILAPHHPAA